MSIDADASHDPGHMARQIGNALANDIPDAVIFADLDGVIRSWNRGATRIFGFSREDAIGKSLNIIIPEPQRERHWAGYRQMIESGRSRYGDEDLLSVPALTKSGAIVSIQFTLAVVHDETGRATGLVALLRDVTEIYMELKRLRKTVSA